MPLRELNYDPLAGLRELDYDPLATSGLRELDYDPLPTGRDPRQDMMAYGGGKLPDSARPPPGKPGQYDDRDWTDIGSRLISTLKASAVKIGGGILESYGEGGPTYDFEKNPLLNPEMVEEGRARRQKFLDLGRSMTKAAQEDIKAANPNLDPWSAKGFSFNVAQVAANLVPAIVGSIATKNPNIGLTIMGGQVFGGNYGEARAEGMSPTAANVESIGKAALETLSEKIPLGILTKEGGQLFPRMLKSMGAESIQEGFVTAVDQAYEARKLSNKEGISFGEAWDKLGGWESVRYGSALGAAAGGGLALATQPFVGGDQTTDEPPPRIEPTIGPPGTDLPKAPLTPGDIESPLNNPLTAPLMEEGNAILETVASGQPLPDLTSETPGTPLIPPVQAQVLRTEGERPLNTEPAPTPVLRNDGSPFPTEQDAFLASKNRKDLKGKGLVPIQVEGGFGLAPGNKAVTPYIRDPAEPVDAAPGQSVEGPLSAAPGTPAVASPAAGVTTYKFPEGAPAPLQRVDTVAPAPLQSAPTVAPPAAMVAAIPSPAEPTAEDLARTRETFAQSEAPPVTTPTVTQPPAAQQPKSEPIRLPDFDRKVSKATGGKGIMVFRGERSGISYDPLTRTVSIGRDVDESEELALAVGQRIKGVSRAKLGNAAVRMKMDDGTVEELIAADVIDDVRNDLRGAHSLLKCVQS